MSSNDEEVEDYMSDAFVANNDIRPSLLFSHNSKVRHNAMKKKLESDPKPMKQLMDQRREEALNKPLDQTNKGFKMFVKMGFKEYENIESEEVTSGSTSQTNSGKIRFLSEPIKIEMKTNRRGLGVERNEQKITKNIRKFEEIEEQFLSHKKSKNELFLSDKDLKIAQKICRNLDIDSGFDEKEFLLQTLRPKWFWPPIEEQLNDDNDTKDDEEVEEDNEECVEFKLKSINDYLRDKYFYCIWCGIKFNDKQDLSDNCLGDTRDDHK